MHFYSLENESCILLSVVFKWFHGIQFFSFFVFFFFLKKTKIVKRKLKIACLSKRRFISYLPMYYEIVQFELMRRIKDCKSALAESSDLGNPTFSVNYLYQGLILQKFFFPLVNYMF